MPEGFTIHPKLVPQLERRREAIGPEGGITWAHAEALAFASLLTEGVPVRLTGQDTARGTFSQRHLELHDVGEGETWTPHTGRVYTPMANLLRASASLELHNSPLSEAAAVGFEYGYSTQAPEALVLWEAQYGDFANGAQIMIDQFIVSGRAKWGETLAAHPAAAARLRGQRPRALLRAHRALPAGSRPRTTSASPTAAPRPTTSTCCASRRSPSASGR